MIPHDFEKEPSRFVHLQLDFRYLTISQTQFRENILRTQVQRRACFFELAIHGLFFFILVFSMQFTVNQCSVKICQWSDLNLGPLVSEATALPTDSQTLTFFHYIRLNTVDRKWKKTANGRIRNEDLWCRKQLVYQLCHKNCPTVLLLNACSWRFYVEGPNWAIFEKSLRQIFWINVAQIQCNFWALL